MLEAPDNIYAFCMHILNANQIKKKNKITGKLIQTVPSPLSLMGTQRNIYHSPVSGV